MEGNKRLDGKLAVITGGNSGIGLATAKLFKAEGAKVIITGRGQEKLDSVANEIGITAIKSDSSNLNDISNLYEQVKEKHGNIDVLFLNAGIAPFVPMEHVTEDHYDNVMDINVKGLYFGVQKALPILNENASIILNSSVVNEMGMSGASVYSASKAAVRSFARTMSAELISKGIRVNVVSPGPIETPIFSKTGMSEEQIAGMKEGMTQTHPMKRFGQPEEIASTVLFLATKDSSYILGEEIRVDGGMTEI